jgi:predicted AlkP superfamily pyrophosphatase or phosphodiesterase
MLKRVPGVRLWLLVLCVLGGQAPLGVPGGHPVEPRAKKVLFIGIDGVRTDALKVANTPYLDSLIRHGAFAENTQILGERYRRNDTSSAPGWASILTGVWADKHGVQDSSFTGANLRRYPDFLHRFKLARPSARTAAFVSWDAIAQHLLVAPDVLRVFPAKGHALAAYLEADAHVADAARHHVAEADPDAVFVYFGLPDAVGHEKGFDPRVPEYRNAIGTVDRFAGSVLRALWARKTVSAEDWLVLVASDHGGKGIYHRLGYLHPEILTVFLIVSGPAAERGRIRSPTYIVDVAATALTHLGVALDDAWGLDGRVEGLKPK